ncbi:MAG TPA: 16S rRNA (cytidine(1402)-2'-O)-methyltransferase [Clostridiales bacterium]|nr:16S rRNA (cytidine(1402)-2'-O)-methyltransferase [Clostridiales bacterium]
MTGCLYVVATPIGNLGDITLRALETLKEVDFIAAEDTRVTIKLLNKYEIKKQLVSYHEHSAKECADGIVERIRNGENCAIVTDAGMPCISDPGEILVKLCYENNIAVKAVPGASAVVSALAISGLNTSRFAFEGFLSVTKKQRFEHLKSITNDTHTLIFYEAPHKLISTLNDMLEYLGDRQISLCRELTKVYEEVIRTTFSGAIAYYENKSPKGEYVLVIEGAKPKANEDITIEDAVKRVNALIEQGEKATDACKAVAKESGYKKNVLYSIIQGKS